MRIIALLILASLTSCNIPFKRTYSFSYMDPHGRTAGVGITLDPVEVRKSGK